MSSAALVASEGKLLGRIGAEQLEIEPLGDQAIRVRATQNSAFDAQLPSGLLDRPPAAPAARLTIAGERATLVNGGLTLSVVVTQRLLGPSLDLTFRETESGRILLQEAAPHLLYPTAREHVPLGGALWRIQTTFAADPEEQFFGLGQHQNGRLNQKGCVIDLVQKNTEVVVPFLLSSRGYGLLWNAPGVGRVELAHNQTRWVLDGAPQLDYLVIGGATPAAILSEFGRLSGRPPAMPDWATGFWQSKLRYRSQEEVLEVAREYAERKLPLACLVIDFFHWSKAGEWQFDAAAFPDPAAMIEELEALGIKTLVSVWPTVNANASTFETMRDRGFLVRNTRGVEAQKLFVDANSDGLVPLSLYDSTHPDAAAFHWERIKAGYLRHGVTGFWLDANEPEVYPTLPDGLLFHAGEGWALFNAHPLAQHRSYAEQLQREGREDAILLSRSGWLGSQRYPVVIWSGDVHSDFAALERQIKAGLSMALSGISWWTSDIGGFIKGDIRDASFRELLIRWFQFAVFCPILRLHGFRMDSQGDPRLGVDFLYGGAGNEIWSFGPEAEAILSDFLWLRETLRPYIGGLMREAQARGIPPMRPLLLDHPEDPLSWQLETQYKFGGDIIVAPIIQAGSRSRAVYAPVGADWMDPYSGRKVAAGSWVTLEAPIAQIPLLFRAEASELQARFLRWQADCDARR